MGTNEITSTVLNFAKSNGLLIILFASIISLVIILWVNQRKKRKTEAGDIAVRKNGNAKVNGIIRLFRYPPLNKIYGKVHARVVLYYPADDFSVNKEVGNLLSKGTIVFLLGVVATIFLGRGDLMFTCAGLLICLVTSNTIMNKKLDEQETLIMNQFRSALEKVCHYYREVPIVEVALLKTIDDLPYEISLHFKTIYDILVSQDKELKMDEYIASSPNKFFTEFLSICASIKENGDAILTNGNSIFVEDINHLKEDVNGFILEDDHKRNVFKGLTAISLIPVIAVKPLENWARARMPELGQYYTGIYGAVAMVVIFAVTYITYKIIELLKDKDIIVEKEDDAWSKILDRVKPLDDFIANIINSNYLKYEKINDDMQAMGDYSGVRVYVFKKITYFVGAVILTIGVFFTSDISQKAEYLHDFSSGFTESVVPSESYRTLMQETAKAYANDKQFFSHYESKTDVDSLTTEITKNTNIKNEAYAREVAQYVTDRMNKYYSTYFKFWYIFIAIVVGTVTCLVPDLFMLVKKNVIENRKADEVMQFQSLMLVLMHMSGMTVSGILEWMERFSFCFREDIAECRINLGRGEQYALKKMQDQTTYEPFANFIDNLLAIDKCGVAEAFSEIETDKAFNKEKRKEAMNERIENNSNLAGFISFAPFATIMILYLIVPILLYAKNMLAGLTQLS